jgi:ubiquinone biosynthesis protein
MSGAVDLVLMTWRLRDLGRVRRIAGVLARHGFADIAARLGPGAWVRGVIRAVLRRPKSSPIPVERRLRQVLEELGPTFIKLGQMLATRPDLVPMALVDELRHLQDEVPPFPFDDVKSIIEAEMGLPMGDVYSHVDEVPIAAASIAQVHSAILRTGEPVVIKVQRPRLNEQITADLRILAGIARLLESRVPETRPFRPRAIVEEFTKSLNRETDFVAEAASMERYRKMFEDEPGLVVPRHYPEWTRRRVLTMERLEGVKVSDRQALVAMGVDLKSIVEIGMRITLRSIFEFGFFHADPHPGNFFVRKDGVIILLDFGMMGTIEPRRVDEMLSFMVAVLTGDVDMVVDQLLDADLIGDDTDLRGLRSDLRSILFRYADADLGSVDVAAFLVEVMAVNIRHHVFLPADLLLVGKSIATMEGIGHQIYPEFKPLEAIRPYLTEVYVRRLLDAKRHSQVVARSVMDGLTLLKDAPFDIRRVLRKLRRGELTIALRSADEESRQQHAASVVNRALLGGLFATFFFGAVILLDQGGTARTVAGWVSAGLSWMFFLGLSWSLLRGDGR